MTTKTTVSSVTRLLMVPIIALALAPPSAQGYKLGAPVEACSDLVPSHNASANETASPFKIELPNGPFKKGSPVEVTIEGSPYFEGFFIQARKKNGSQAIGQFSKFPNETHGVDCHGKISSAATHSSDTKRNRTVLTWTATETGTVVFRATVVKGKVTFWTDIYSREFEISRAGSIGFQSLIISFIVLPALIAHL